MELSAIQSILELTGDPAFVAEDGRILWVNQEAEALGLRRESALCAALPGIRLPAFGTEALETALLVDRRRWTLQSIPVAPWTVCVLRPERPFLSGPNENSLLHAAGRIRAALQELHTALDGLCEQLPETPPARRQAALGLRGIYQLRRTAEELELFARLQAGSYRLNRQSWAVGAQTAALCGELGELLRPAGIELLCETPKRDFRACLDWPLTAALLRELTANAAAHSADGRLCLRLSRSGKGKLRFSLRNRSEDPLPEQLFQRHRTEECLPQTGLGLGLDLVSAGAALHGGEFLISRDGEGGVTALLTVSAAAEPDENLRAMLQLPVGSEAALTALSTVLPAELYAPEDLL